MIEFQIITFDPSNIYKHEVMFTSFIILFCFVLQKYCKEPERSYI